jgi:hypothetical protein
MTVHLTPAEARALRLASIFGGPDHPYADLQPARAKLREAERESKAAAEDAS